jgi:protein disulfide-isomerase
MRPTAMLVDLAINNPTDLQAGDFTQLAYYSWQQDHTALPKDQGSDLFRSLAELAGDKNTEASARLYMHYLATLADEREANNADDESDAPPVQHSAMPDAIARVKEILASDELVLACWDYLTYASESLITLISTEGEIRNQLVSLWQQRTLSQRHDESLSTAEQLGGWFPALELFWLTYPEGELDSKLLSDLKADVARADKITKSPYARQSVVNQMNHLLQTAKLYDEAEKMLLAELDTSPSAYYFMSSLASLSEKQERFEEALEWRRKAYESSQGDATRFQWGANYIRSIIRLKPEQHDLIVKTSLNLFNELESSDEIFAGRNFRVVRALNNKLKEWQKGREENDQQVSLDPFHERLAQLCAEQDAAKQESKNCSSLLEGSASSV